MDDIILNWCPGGGHVGHPRVSTGTYRRAHGKLHKTRRYPHSSASSAAGSSLSLEGVTESLPGAQKVSQTSHDWTNAMIHALSSTSAPVPPTDPAPLMQKARALEAAFLAEMLAHSGLDESSSPFSGGAGEAQFTSFLRQEHARLMVEKGGLGLAQLLFQSLTGDEQ